jgi:outer membrane protein assembly factor BamD
MVFNKSMEDYRAAMDPATYAAHATPLPAASENATAPQAQPSDAPIALQDVPAAGNGAADDSTVANAPANSSGAAPGGSSVGIEIVQPSGNSPVPAENNGAPPAFPGSETAAPATAAAASSPTQSNGDMDLIQPKDAASKTLTAPIEKAADAPDAVNEATPGAQPSAQAATNGAKVKSTYDKSDESSSRHKKKKGLAKLNPL